MSNPLLVAWGQEFVDELLDALGPDAVVQVVVGKPTLVQWKAAPVVVIDSRIQVVAESMPAHPNMVVAAPAKLDGERLAAAVGVQRRPGASGGGVRAAGARP